MFRAMEEKVYKRQSSLVSDDNGNEDNTELLPAPFDSDGIPVNWCKVGDSQPFILVQLKPGQLEYEKISADFSRENIKVSKIERLQNMIYLDRFKSELEEIKKTHRHDFNPNVRYLYHGTCSEVSRICEEGLDQRLSRMGHFGKGIYFSDSPIKCLHQSDFLNHPERAIILKCRVVLGDCKIFEPGHFDSNLTREPEKENPEGGYRFFDSVMGCPKDFNEYVVYENRRVMVEYIISFEVDEEMQKLVMPMVDSFSQEVQEKKKSSGNVPTTTTAPTTTIVPVTATVATTTAAITTYVQTTTVAPTTGPKTVALTTITPVQTTAAAPSTTKVATTTAAPRTTAAPSVTTQVDTTIAAPASGTVPSISTAATTTAAPATTYVQTTTIVPTATAATTFAPTTTPPVQTTTAAPITTPSPTTTAWKYIAVGIGVGAVGFVATPLIATAALGTVGFTSGGVAAGSIAAAMQASIGNIAAGSAFAMAQSAGATGVVSVGTQIAGGTIFGTLGAAVMKFFKRKPTEEKKSDEKE